MPLGLLLNWRTYAALALAASWAFAFHFGANSVQVKFDLYKNEQVSIALAAQTAAREKEHAMQASNQKVTENYESLKTATATAVGALDSDRMRLQAALAASSVPPDTGAGLRPDAAPKDRILSECLRRYEEVAADSDALADQVIGLQAYITKVVPKWAP